MRFLLLVAFAVTACSNEPGARSSEAINGRFAGAGRNAMCIAGKAGAQRSGVIVYGEADMNCSASGPLKRSDGGWEMVPDGEGDCAIPLHSTGPGLWRIGAVSAACDYYCAPGVSFSGASFAAKGASFKPVDLAGEPLC